MATASAIRFRLLCRQALAATAPLRRAGNVTCASRSQRVRGLATASTSEGFLDGSSSNYVEAMYEAYLRDPSSVHVSWQAYFRNLSQGDKKPFSAPPTLVPSISGPALAHFAEPGEALPSGEIVDHLKVQLIARAYQVRGHHLAKLDPLGINDADLDPSTPPELEPSYYGFKESDMDRKFSLGPGMLPGYKNSSPQLTLREIVQRLKDVYCGSIGIEYAHIPDRGQCDWLRERLEIPDRIKFSKDEKKVILDRLIWSDSFERFVSTKYPSEKRFGLEGCESLIPGMKALIDQSVENGVESVVMGMPHRGRLNVLSNVVRKPNEHIFCEFSGSVEPNLAEGSGDVKYHLGMNYDRPTPSGKRVHLSLVANPSHLEAVNPVVQGKARAMQFYANDNQDRGKTMSLLLHGDAAFAGQGIVYETLGFSDLPSYTTGGTIHIIVNNQVGFTTDPRFSRSTPYCSDVAKTVGAPILHVNGDDVESVVYACQLAADWRKQFKTDFVIDIVCYRRHGHNEIDQPSFTQPRMYQIIAKQEPVLDKYARQLKNENALTQEEIEANKKHVWNLLEEVYERSKDYKPTAKDWVSSAWHGFKSPKELSSEIVQPKITGIDTDTLTHIGQHISSYPPGFNIHPQLTRIMKARAKTVEEGEGIDWATAEAMAFGSLLLEGRHVRLSGQDVERGTFSQRHAVLHDQKTEEQHVPLNNLSPSQAVFTVTNSHLSEYGVLGFELGYSLVDPNALIIWEAQFGDFANTAQVIIDQFIASGERKWLQRTGLVLNLPHGFDGQGPEHSSGRLERILQLSDENPYKFPDETAISRQHQDCNVQVAYPSTPANYFHLLRRQIHRDFRKPLALFFSKSLLRHPLAKSPMLEMGPDTRFQRVLPETSDKLVADEQVQKVVFCTGQVYYILLRAREANNVDDVALIRVEQLAPFPFDLVSEQLDKYSNAKVMWAQEEPLNMGCWTYVEPRIKTCMRASESRGGRAAHQESEAEADAVRETCFGQPATSSVLYAGRGPSGAVATGVKKLHVKEEQALISQVLFGKVLPVQKVESGVPVFAE